MQYYKKEEQKKGVNVEIQQEEDKTTITKSIDGVAYSSRTMFFKDGSYKEKSKTFILDGQDDILENTIALSPNFCDFTFHELNHNKSEGVDTETFQYPLIDYNGQIFGEKKDTEISEENGRKTIRSHAEIETDSSCFIIDTVSEGVGQEYKEEKTINIKNKLSGAIEIVKYTRDEQGGEQYTTTRKKIRSTARGTTIDICNEKGQSLETYEYDGNGNALIPMEEIQQLPEGYIEKCFSDFVPKYYTVPHIVPKEVHIQPDDQAYTSESIKAASGDTKRSDLEYFNKEIRAQLTQPNINVKQ